MNYSISYHDLGVAYADCGPWRSYELNTQGSSYLELLENATISEVNQEGEDIRFYGIEECSEEVEQAVIKTIRKKLKLEE